MQVFDRRIRQERRSGPGVSNRVRISEFLYELPDELIAQIPLGPRDSARLLRGVDLSDWNVRDLPELLESGDLVVLNETRVRAARLDGRRAETGGAVELLLLGRVGERWEACFRTPTA